MGSHKPHSAAYFTDARDFWWDPDFLRLMARRWDLRKVRSVLDAGCGIGHWGQALCPVLPRGARIVGIDPESRWVRQAARRARSRGLARRCDYRLGRVEAQPFPDACFDLVTCQTLLIHVKDPKAALKEMLRVLRPGGLLAVAEPNNLAGSLIRTSLSARQPERRILKGVKAALASERRKRAQGKGDSSLGDLLPGLFAQLGLSDIRVHLSDKAWPLFPPYASDEQKAILGQLRRFKQKRVLASVRKREFHQAGGALMYLVSGRKPN